MKKLLATLAFLALAIGCKAQIPPATTHTVVLTWTAPVANSTWTGCTTSAPCVYAIYRCSGSATACGDTTNSAWSEITTSTTRVSGTTYTDATASGLTAYYAAVTYQGTAHSGASNTAGPFVVPGSPLAPQLGAGSVAENDGAPAPIPPSSGKELAWAPKLSAKFQ